MGATKSETKDGYLTPTADVVSELSESWTKVTSFGDGVEDAPRSVTTVEWPSVSAPLDPDLLVLQGEEHHESRNGNSTSECRRGDAKCSD